MESEYRAVQHEHISFEDIERVNSLGEYPGNADWDLFLKVHEMVDSCSVCRQRYKLYINLQSTFAAFSPEKSSLSESAAQYFQGFLAKADQALREKLTS